MKPLSKELRANLEKIVVKAREVVEEGARAVLQQYAVDAPQPYEHLSADERELRRRLRAHARQQGDKRDPETDAHSIEHLITEFAYEHWHRMLFARFLAENNLLIHPEEGVPVSLADCEDLAADEDVANGWKLAERYAAQMLPQIFRPDAPVLALSLPPEYYRELESLIDSLSTEVFFASGSLGWVYQFWQAKRKDEINKSEVKIGADELPAVTQIFTEPYMVQFLLDNSVGAWWTSRHPREKSAVRFDCLRALSDGTPAAGKFEGWPDTVKELKILDPCCGSGHFLVTAFRMLVPMRMVEESLSAKEACDAVLRDNLYGLELDERCTQIAVFNLALAVWTYPKAGGYRRLPEMHIACSGLPVGAKREEWIRFVGRDSRLREGMTLLYSLFQDAPILGSLINPSKRVGDLLSASFSELKKFLQLALTRENVTGDDINNEIGIAAQGLVKAAELLTNCYHLVITNVPYLVRGKHCKKLKTFCDSQYSFEKHDLAYVFLRRCIELCREYGAIFIVLPENWLYINPCKALRKHMLSNYKINFICRLGPGAFETISGEVVKAMLFSLTKQLPKVNDIIVGIDTWSATSVSEKTRELKASDLHIFKQSDQKSNPDSRISFEKIKVGELLQNYASGLHGQGTFDKSCFVLNFWEVQFLGTQWVLQQTTPLRKNMNDYGARRIFRWENGSGLLYRFMQRKKAQGYSSGKWRAGVNIWGSKGIAISGMGSLYVVPYLGKAFDENIAVIKPHKDRDLLPIYAYCRSASFKIELGKIDKNLKASCNTLVKIPFDLNYWKKITGEKYPNGLSEPYSEDPTQWIFRGAIMSSEAPLQVAVARLLGYRWPEQVEDNLDDLIDDDGIVCIPPVRGEQSAEARLKSLIARAYGDKLKVGTLDKLLDKVGYKGNSLEIWLRQDFFEQHLKLFPHRPFIWHIWDGRHSDGFAALLNYHKLNRHRLEILTYTYLGDWIRRQEDDLEREVGGAKARLLAARELQEKLKKILEGEKPYDIFVRWKPLEEQPLGWEPGLNDGIRLNIRPFVIGGVLRKDPKVNWKKDRGKDPEGSHWGVERINDRHLSLDEKRKARAAKNISRVVI